MQPESTPFSPILRIVTSLEEAMDPRQAMKNMEDSVEQVFRVIQTFPCHFPL